MIELTLTRVEARKEQWERCTQFCPCCGKGGQVWRRPEDRSSILVGNVAHLCVACGGHFFLTIAVRDPYNETAQRLAMLRNEAAT